MYIQTVNEQISPDSLGVTLSHEHIIIDYRYSNPKLFVTSHTNQTSLT